MKILALECSAAPASAAVFSDGAVVASTFCNIKQTHSQTLLPMVRQVLDLANLSLEQLDGVAVGNGPGSFTGIRIAIAAVKGLCAARNIPCVGVSTTAAMAFPFADCNAVICGVMDARCNQVYNALFRVENGTVTRLCADRAVLCQALAEELLQTNFGDLPIYIVGDGRDLFYPFVADNAHFHKAGEALRFQTAIGVGLAAQNDFQNGKTVSAAELLPMYLRLPQAERELKAKQRGSLEK